MKQSIKKPVKQPAGPARLFPAGMRAGRLLPAGLRVTALLLLAACLAGCFNGKSSVTRNRAGTRSVVLPGGSRQEELWQETPDPWQDAAPSTEPEAASASGDYGGYGEIPAGGYTGPNPEAALPKAPVHETPPIKAPTGGLVEIGEKLFIAQTNDVYLNPEDYLGKTIRLQGLFKKMQYEGGGGYCFVLRYGPGCCGNDGSAGFEVSWDREDPDPPPYPNEDDWVEAEGVLGYYREDDYPYLYLNLLSLKVKETRGAEFVSQ
ncbi:MAG: hypothetical protein LBS06_04975 [Treponema sp.]|jgi:hypothetical protein|nr:hypothetical protein [Treponema sp.]